MSAAGTRLVLHERVLLETGTAVVAEVYPQGVRVITPLGLSVEIPYTELTMCREMTGGKVDAAVAPLMPLLRTLTPEATNDMINHTEHVQEVLCAFRRGHPDLALPDEPRGVYDPARGASLRVRCRAKAEELTRENAANRTMQRRVEAGELNDTAVSASTVRSWVRRFQRGEPLVDGRHTRGLQPWAIDPLLRARIEQVVTELDGTISSVSDDEVLRRARVRIRDDGVLATDVGLSTCLKFIALLRRQSGKTTRSQRTRYLATVSSYETYPAMVPGQVVAVDATRADGLVRDPSTGRVFSVEILTAIDVATRVILALRVVPRSANALDASLLIYDVLRPFSQLVEGTTVHDWRWAGIPQHLDTSHVPTPSTLTLDLPGLQGEHPIPGLCPRSVRTDQGSIFMGRQFMFTLDRFGIDLMPTRGGRGSDNAYVERLHETYQRALSEYPGYKGRCVSQRGSRVGIDAVEALFSPLELEQYLRRWVAIDYHRRPHSGLRLPGAHNADVSPLDLFDARLHAAGRLDVPQRADLIYDFLPIAWLTPGPTGVERANLIYDTPKLNDFRNPRRGQFQPGTRKMPFFLDPHDLSRLWFRHPDSGEVIEVPWRDRFKIDVPLTDIVLTQLLSQIVRRHPAGADGRPARLGALPPRLLQTQIINALGDLSRCGPDRELEPLMTNARMRVSQSRRDHAEADDAHGLRGRPAPGAPWNGKAGEAGLPARPGDHANTGAPTDLLNRPWPDLRTATR